MVIAGRLEVDGFAGRGERGDCQHPWARFLGQAHGRRGGEHCVREAPRARARVAREAR